MTTDPDDGAFPLKIDIVDLNGLKIGTTTYTGVTKLEYLVGQLLEGAANYYGTPQEVAMIVKRAVAIAKATIIEINRA